MNDGITDLESFSLLHFMPVSPKPVSAIRDPGHELPLLFDVPPTSVPGLSTAFPFLSIFASLLNCDSVSFAALETPHFLHPKYHSGSRESSPFPVATGGLDTDIRSSGPDIISENSSPLRQRLGGHLKEESSG